MQKDEDAAGKLVFHKKGGVSLYDEAGKKTKPQKDPPSDAKLKKVGEMTIEFYDGSCWIKICQGGVCQWYFWPGPGCPF